jgi:hypothetical protein
MTSPYPLAIWILLDVGEDLAANGMKEDWTVDQMGGCGDKVTTGKTCGHQHVGDEVEE